MSETDWDETTVESEETDVSLNNATTPHYNEPEDADRYPVAIPSPLPAHTVFKGDPQIDGPYLDDIREAQADARRRANDPVSELQKKKAEEGQKLLETLQDAEKQIVEAATPTEEITSEETDNSWNEE